VKRCHCKRPGYRFRGKRWQCVIHFRLDTMRACAKAAGKKIPTVAELGQMFDGLRKRGMRCEACNVRMRWAGRTSDTNTVSLQHDASGRLRLLCRRCNSRHGQMPGDLFYELVGTDRWYCARCETVKPLSDFYKNRAGSCCKPCRKKLNKEMWALYGRQWYENSQRRKQA